MTEFNSLETHNIYSNLEAIPVSATLLNGQKQLRLNKINEIKDFIAEIKEKELISKRLGKYCFFWLFWYAIVLSVTTGNISIASFATVIGAPVGIVSTSFSLAFSMFTGTVKKLLKTTKSKNKKHNKIVMSARSKLNSIETKISEALIKSEIKHENFMTTINEENKCWELKESIRMRNSQRRDTEKVNLIEEG